MRRRRWSLVIALVSVLPFVLAASQDAPVQDLPSEQVFKDIKSFKGVPAKDLIPAMKFMCASLKWECTNCHDKDDYAAETKLKETTREMIELQREINTKYFDGKLEVTCNSCHGGKEHPVAVPTPEGLKTRHERFRTALTPDDFFKKHMEAVGSEPVVLTMTGTVQKGEEPKKPYTLVQGQGDRFLITSGEQKMGSDGKVVWFQEGPSAFKMWGEGEASVGRLGRSWRNAAQFAMLEGAAVNGRETIGTAGAVVVRGARKAFDTTEELYFDQESGLLVRVVALTRSTIGTVVSTFDYEDYRSVDGVKVPFRMVTTVGGTEKTVVQFESATKGTTLDDKLFAMPGGS